MIRARVMLIVVGAAIAGASTATEAQAPVTIAARHVRAVPITVARLVSASPRSIDVLGIVQDHRGLPVPNAGTVLVRELQTGAVAGRTEVNALAQFNLRGLPPGLYTAELVTPSGTVIASTPAFAATAGQVVQISQTIPSPPVQAFSQMLRTATSAVLSSAASSGVLALRPGAPITPGS